MGVCNLWNVLEPVKKQTSLSQLSGQTVAIDLGGLIVQSSKAGQQSTVTDTFMMIIRVLFYRILNLLKQGIKPLFVLDGSAPLIKAENLLKRQLQQGHSPSKSTERLKFKTCQEKCLPLLDALGIPYISSTGEAEKLCAILNNSQVVDACMTDDSDSFLYGAKTVYRNYEHSKDTTIEVYNMTDIEEKLNLNRRDLVAYALLAGCDYNESGVQGLGQTKSCTLIQDLKKSHPDVLERIQSWRQDSHLKALQKNKEKLVEFKKEKHCSSCLHLGSKSIHKQKGCEVCDTTNDCTTDNTVLCQCPWHHLHNQTAPFATELGIRDKALRDDKFPDTRIIDEFLNDDGYSGVQDIKWKVPNWRDLKSVFQLHFRKNPDNFLKQVINAVVCMSLHGILPLTTIKPLKIEKACQDNFKACYQTQWSIQDEGWPNESVENNTIKTEKCLLKSKFPLIVEDFEKQQEEKQKQKSSEKKKKSQIKKNPQQMTMDKFFSSRKRLNFDSCSTSKKKKKVDEEIIM